MRYVPLGSSELQVSEVCLGTMTWGKQNTMSEGHQQIEYALEKGVNFIDTAEMYAIPPSEDTYGTTEIIIGQWLKENRAKRADLILASKIAGNGLPWIRNGADISGKTIEEAVNNSLKRLQTDYIDLFQLHWPNRRSPHFSKHWPGMIKPTLVNTEKERDAILDILQGLDRCVKSGKIRYCGLSDDTTWGVNEYLRLADKFDLPRITAIQNEFSLLHCKDWPYLIENCIMENVAYLPWSPLAGGALSGKYANGAKPAGSRWAMTQRNGLFRDQIQSHQAIAAYKDIAGDYNMSVTTLALAWCKQFEGVTSTIIGATSMGQLVEDIAAFEINLNEEILGEINKVFRKYPVPF